MGNLQVQCRGKTHNEIEFDHRQNVYLPNETISGHVSHLQATNASLVLTGVISFRKRKRHGLEKVQITFFTTECPLTSHDKQNFQLKLDEDLPPSFNDMSTYPNVTYTINLLSGNSKRQTLVSIPICVCPRITIDRPLLLTPLFFGPIENQSTNLKLEVKINRAIFTFDELIQIFYELQNPKQILILKTEISLGVYYTIQSNVYQNDISTGFENASNISSRNRLIRNKVLLNIPHKIYLPPTFKFQYEHENDGLSFQLNIEYKIQFKVFFGDNDSLWQVDIPIVLCNEKLNLDKHEQNDFVVNTNLN